MIGAVLAAATLWVPAPGATIQVQLAGKVDTSVAAEVFYVDAYDTPKATVDELHANGAHVVCYMSAGSWEEFRTDAGKYPKRVLGRKLAGYPDERWVDVRRRKILLKIIGRRLDRCVNKGFDGADFDNVDGYTNKTGFPLKARDQLRFNRALAAAAHARGLSASLKNDVDQTEQLAGDFDFALNEQCLVYDECERYQPFVDAGKAVFHIEYEGDWPADKSCEFPGFSSIRKRFTLRAYRAGCSSAR
ncbi:MAG: hypothetical protein QOI80_2367 [Solirubrobacteraceae bacterium]|jgi:hypothetical protein|nr:hypothetical protein [Solirubrobacteraceae bacterium]